MAEHKSKRARTTRNGKTATTSKTAAPRHALRPKDFIERPVVETPYAGRPINLGDGKTLQFKSMQVVDGDVSALERVAVSLVARAREAPASPWLTPAAHVVAALVAVLQRGEIDALKQPHTWARAVLRPKSTTEHSWFYLANEDAKGRLVAHDTPVAGFDSLVKLLGQVLEVLEERGRQLSDFAEFVTQLMLRAFPSIASLGDDSLDAYEATFCRVREQLVALQKKWKSVEDAKEIAEHLVRTELKLSGHSDAEVDRRLHFIEQRATRAASTDS